MDQNNAQVGQEATPADNLISEQNPQGQTAESTMPMEMLLETEGLNLDFPKSGEIRKGVIASIGDNEILVSIGTKSEGVITGREKDQIPPEDLAAFEVGKEILVYVLVPEDQNGNVILSYTRAREESDWQMVEEMMTSGDVYQGKIVGFNKGGLIVPVGDLRGFVPASQVSVMRRSDTSSDSPEARWGKMTGESIMVRVIEVDRQRHRLILSERSALQETRETIKERLLEELEEGGIRTGRVTSLADFGAFVNIDGADGLVHLSEISWERIEHPNEVLRVGQEVQVKIIAVDRERKRIGLSIRQLLPDPWLRKIEHLREGQLVEGTVTHLTKFGAFARLGEDIEGLIHVSELSESRVNHPKEIVKEGDVVTLRIIKIDPERRRIGLSLRKVDSLAYADLDWKMSLADEVGGAQVSAQEAKEEIIPEAPVEEPVETLQEIPPEKEEIISETPVEEPAETLQEIPPEKEEIVSEAPVEEPVETLQEIPPEKEEIISETPVEEPAETLQEIPPEKEVIVSEAPVGETVETLQEIPPEEEAPEA